MIMALDSRTSVLCAIQPSKSEKYPSSSWRDLQEIWRGTFYKGL